MLKKTIKFPFKMMLIVLDGIIALLCLPVLMLISVLYRSRDIDPPKVGWGPTPIKPIHYNSLALRSLGVTSYTFVDELYSINNRSDFDFYLRDLTSPLLKRFSPTLSRCIFFVTFLKNCNVLVTNFDGGLLRYSKLRYVEHFFLKLARKSIVVWPYGSDSFIYSKIADHNFRYGLYQSYPEGAKREAQIQKQIDYFVQHADVVIGNIPHHEALPRWDVLTVACYCVDGEEWKSQNEFKHTTNGRDSVVTILHCPNHRRVKGTEFIIKAVDELKAEGFKIDLKILENVKNSEVLEAMRSCDIVAAQALYGYASTEIEGMSLCKPVISNLNFSAYYDSARNYTYFKDCPLVSASPLDLKERLRELITSPEARKELGKRGRVYVEKYHSLHGQGKFWSRVVECARNKNHKSLDNWWVEKNSSDKLK